MIGCDKDKNDGNSNGNANSNNNSNCNLKASITPAAGWEKNNSVQQSIWFKGTPYGSISLTVENIPSDINTADEYALFIHDELKKAFQDVEFSSISETTIEGRDAVEYYYTATVMNKEMKYRMIHICLDSCAYTIACGCLESDFDSLAGEYQSMIDSYTLTE